MSRLRLLLVVVLMLLAAPGAGAAVRAWLDRDHVAVGDPIQLTIETDGSPGRPDLSALGRDFEVHGTATGSQTTIINGTARTTTQWAVTLAPRHGGVIDIPSIVVGNGRTPPLRVAVATLAQAASPSTSGAVASTPSGTGPVFIESAIAPEHPYVGQATIYTLRLYYAVPPLDASLDLPAPDNGDLRQVGDDQHDSVMVGGHRYDVVERHYLLLPERSGTMHIPAPEFQGRTMPGLAGVFDDDTVGSALHATGKAFDVPVRARPPNAAGPWLPAKSLQVTVDAPATAPVAGEPFGVVVHLAGDGVTAAQLPEITLPPVPGAQVYPEPSSTIEHARGGSLQAERTRRFAIVPERSGELRLPEFAVPWWDVVNDRAAVAKASLPAVRVRPGAATGKESGEPAAPPSRTETASVPVHGASETHVWQVIALVLAVALVLALAWGWRRGRGIVPADAGEDRAAAIPVRWPTLDEALASGDASAITFALVAAAHAAAPRERAPEGLAAVAARLDDPGQREAVLAFDAARWRADGTPAPQALDRLRSAFAKPPRWSAPARPVRRDASLPPLYPDAS